MANVLMLIWGLKDRAGGVTSQVVTDVQCEYVKLSWADKCAVECVPLDPPKR
jgi:hypothetical protein